MSGKSELKRLVFRRDGRILVPLAQCAVRPFASVASARTVFIDASVWWAAGPYRHETTGAEFAARVASACSRAFCGRVHTVVVSFDKRRYVPIEKSMTQARRDAKLDAAPRRFESPIMAGELPNWHELRANRPAFERAQAELVAMFVDSVHVPASARLIVDYGSADDTRPLLVDAAGLRREGALENDVGEADMLAQRVQLAARGLAVASRWGRAFIAGYEPGDVVLWSSDTDYLTLSALHDVAACPFRVYVSTGRGAGADSECAELFSVRDMPVLGTDLLSFVVVSSLCGNDYLDKFVGASRAQLLAAARTMSVPLARRCGAHALVDPRALVEFLERVYAARLGEVAPARGDYARLATTLDARRVTSSSLPHALDATALRTLYAFTQWSADYSLRGPRGAAHVCARRDEYWHTKSWQLAPT